MKTSRQKSQKENKLTGNALPKVVVILGPNSSGKSELGAQLALAFNGEIVSADSRQIYKGLNISSSKVPGKWERRRAGRYFVYKGVVHHLIDVVSPRKQFSAGKYKKKAKRIIGNIIDKGGLPIVVGGTGFYIDSLVHDLNFPKVPPQPKLRKELESLTTEQLVKRLSGLDPRRAESIDKKNRRRLIRAIEIVVLTKSQVPELTNQYEDSPYNLLKIGLKLPDEALKARMDSTIEERVRSGVVNEIKTLHRRGISWKRIDNLGMEYRFISAYIRGEIDADEMKDSMKKEYWRYGKRQMTWFKRDPNIIWVDYPEKAFPIVQDFLAREGEPSPAR